jgi:hypothetical protein
VSEPLFDFDDQDEGLGATPPTVYTRTYPAADQAEAWEASAADRASFAARGYWPAGQVWSDGVPGVARIMFLGWLAAFFPPNGRLTITYVRRAATAS